MCFVRAAANQKPLTENGRLTGRDFDAETFYLYPEDDDFSTRRNVGTV